MTRRSHPVCLARQLEVCGSASLWILRATSLSDCGHTEPFKRRVAVSRIEITGSSEFSGSEGVAVDRVVSFGLR